MAWNYARYVGYVAQQGKNEYPLPMFVNAALAGPGSRGPGDYPSGGPEPLVHDVCVPVRRRSTSWRPTSTIPIMCRS